MGMEESEYELCKTCGECHHVDDSCEEYKTSLLNSKIIQDLSIENDRMKGALQEIIKNAEKCYPSYSLLARLCDIARNALRGENDIDK